LFDSAESHIVILKKGFLLPKHAFRYNVHVWFSLQVLINFETLKFETY